METNNGEHQLNTLCNISILSWVININDVFESIPSITESFLEIVYDMLTLKSLLQKKSAILQSAITIIVENSVHCKMNWVQTRKIIMTKIDKIHRKLNCQPCTECERKHSLPRNIKEDILRAIHHIKLFIGKLDGLSRLIEPYMIAICGDDLKLFESSEATSDANDITFRIYKQATPSKDTMFGIEEIQDMEL